MDGGEHVVVDRAHGFLELAEELDERGQLGPCGGLVPGGERDDRGGLLGVPLEVGPDALELGTHLRRRDLGGGVVVLEDLGGLDLDVVDLEVLALRVGLGGDRGHDVGTDAVVHHVRVPLLGHALADGGHLRRVLGLPGGADEPDGGDDDDSCSAGDGHDRHPAADGETHGRTLHEGVDLRPGRIGASGSRLDLDPGPGRWPEMG